MSKEAPKVGTKFRWVGGESEFYTQGNTYSVTTEVVEAGLFSIDDNLGPHWWDTWSMEGKFVEVVGSPIRTRREIVPGVYGYIGIENISERSACVGVRGVEGKYGDRYLSPDELREAAHILNQIAEVLEENAG